MTKLMTRKEYMSLPYEKRDHNQYYGQFVTSELKEVVKARFGVSLLCGAFKKDRHFNTLRLQDWDALYVPYEVLCLLAEANESKYYCTSYSDRVCVAKEAARIVVEENTASTECLSL